MITVAKFRRKFHGIRANWASFLVIFGVRFQVLRFFYVWLGTVSASNLEALRELCARRDEVLQDIVKFHGVAGDVELGKTARDAAKDLPIRLLHGGGYAAWTHAHGMQEREQRASRSWCGSRRS